MLNTSEIVLISIYYTLSQVNSTSEKLKKNKMAFVGILSQIKLLFGPLVIQLMWYILKQLFTSVSVKVVDVYLATSWLCKYPPLFTSTSVNNLSNTVLSLFFSCETQHCSLIT